MLRHEFQPGRLIAGLFITAAGIAYAGDAGGAWETEWFAVIPIVVCGLFLAGLAGMTARAIRKRRRAARAAGGEARADSAGPAPSR